MVFRVLPVSNSLMVRGVFMREEPSAATVGWVGNAATVTVHGGLDQDGAAEVRKLISEVAANHPARLVLDLTGVSDSYGAECLAMVAVARHLLPRGCAVDVRSENAAVRQVLALAERNAAETSPGKAEGEAV